MFKFTNAIAVFGYNNTRLYDVEKIKKLASELNNASLILVKEGITAADLEVTPYCLDADPASPTLAPDLLALLEKNKLSLTGCLPFSDKGVVGAAHAAKAFGLFHDDPETSGAMLDKKKFRELERMFVPVSEEVYKKPFFNCVTDADQLFEIFDKVGTFFIKPSAEGNSRGCMKIETREDLLLWLENHGKYLANGVMCEEYLSSGSEYSFDGLNSSYWITEKFTTSGAYRAEYQHIVPAPLSSDLATRVRDVLTPLLIQLGTRGGAFHHEFFILKNNVVASVEPNRRPAGMWLWDLAEWSFEGFKTWSQWLEVCSGQNSAPAALNSTHFSGVRGAISPKNGRIVSINENAIREELAVAMGGDVFRMMLFKKAGDVLTCEPKDNSDFISFFATRDSNYQSLRSKLDLAEAIILKHIVLAEQL